MFDYICTICGEPFSHFMNDYHVNHVCPYCGQDLEPAERCEVCGELVPHSRFTYSRCEKHKEETLHKFQTFIASLSPGELTYLEDKTDGVFWKDLKEVC